MKIYTLNKQLLVDSHLEVVTKIDCKHFESDESLVLTVFFEDMESMILKAFPNSENKGYQITLSQLGWAADPLEVPAPYEMFNERTVVALSQLRIFDEFRKENKNPTTKQINDRLSLEMMRVLAEEQLSRYDKIVAASERIANITTPFPVRVQYLLEKNYITITAPSRRRP